MFPGTFNRILWGMAAVCLAAVTGVAVADGAEGVIVLKPARVYTGNGITLDEGMIVVRNGRIEAVGRNLAIPPGAVVVELPGASVTPGLIDANAIVEPMDLLAPDRLGIGATHDGHDPLCRFLSGGRPHHHHHHGEGLAADGGPRINCCGTSCPRSHEHVTGERCLHCGFPEQPPILPTMPGHGHAAVERASFSEPDTASAVGVRLWMSHAEQSSEVIPHTRVLDSVNLASPDFGRLLAGGVTMVFVAPDPAAVISSRGAIVRTGGPDGLRVVQEADAVRAVMGSEPSAHGRSNELPWGEYVTFHTRRPNTRMGVAWVFRKAFYDAGRFAAGLPVGGADTPSEAAMQVLGGLLKGEVGLRIQARTQTDILTALRLAGEFNLRFTLEEGTEAYKCLEELRATRTPVIFGPILDRPTGMWFSAIERQGTQLKALRTLLDGGIVTALSAQYLRNEAGLARQAMKAMKYGLTREEALAAVTSVPATILGIDKEFGTLEPGKWADLVAWNGEPFEAASRPVLVMAAGVVVRDLTSE